MNERLKKLRKALDLTQQEFADRIRVKRNTIATYEIGRNTPLDAVIASICREFNVLEDWLRTGEGEMFVPKEEDTWEEVVKRRGLSDGDRLLIEKFMNLKAAEREVVMEYVMSVAADYAAPTQAEPDAGKDIPVPATAPDIAAELAELKRQNQELAAEVAAMKEEDALRALFDQSSSSATDGATDPAHSAKK